MKYLTVKIELGGEIQSGADLAKTLRELANRMDGQISIAGAGSLRTQAGDSVGAWKIENAN